MRTVADQVPEMVDRIVTDGYHQGVHVEVHRTTASARRLAAAIATTVGGQLFHPATEHRTSPSPRRHELGL